MMRSGLLNNAPRPANIGAHQLRWRTQASVTQPLGSCRRPYTCMIRPQAFEGRGRLNARRRAEVTVGVGPGPSGHGDLYGGQDDERNKAVSSLRNLFVQSPDVTSSEEDPEESRGALQLGLRRDLPLCRWSFVLLPHHQARLNVWQPQYTLLFERLLATPPPHYYMHLYTPGGVDSLDDPVYELKPGTEAPLAGTLMRIVGFHREGDSRLALTVQGLARAVVVRPTQTLPYARADVQLLPDFEALLSCARISRCWVDDQRQGEVDDEVGGASPPPEILQGVRATKVLLVTKHPPGNMDIF